MMLRRFHRSLHRHVRLLTERALGFETICYGDPLQRNKCKVEENIRQIISFRGTTFSPADHVEALFSRYTPRLPYRIPPKFWWGPGRSLKKSRDPYDFLLGPSSMVKEIADRWDELMAEKSYSLAMRIADEINAAMRNGSYHGIPYSEISLLQAAKKEGLTTEELALFYDTDWDVGENYFVKMSILHLGQLYIRYFALLSTQNGAEAFVTTAERKNGVLQRAGMGCILEEMLQRTSTAGVRVFYNAKVTSIRRAKSGGLRLTFSEGGSAVARKVIANIGKPDLVAMGLESEPMKSGGEQFRRSVERIVVAGLSKTYCFWEDAWWLTKLQFENGRMRTDEEIYSIRYHDGFVTCKNSETLQGCRGGLLTSYVAGDTSGTKSGIYLHGHNEMGYTPLTNVDNVHRLVAGNMSGIEQIYFDDLHRQLRKLHRSAMAEKGFDVNEAIPGAAGCVFADLMDVGVHVVVGPRGGDLDTEKRFVRPVEDLHISLVNEAWGQDNGWAESALNSAERALFHEYAVARPRWMDDTFHKSVIRMFNQGV